MRLFTSILSKLIITAGLLLASCSSDTEPTATPTEIATDTPAPSPIAATAAAPPTSASTLEATAAGASTPGPVIGAPNPTPVPATAYLDNRSDGVSLIASFVNALNRKEYVRAYSYFEPAAQNQLPPFNQFQQGYANTAAVDVKFGTIGGDAGAGQFYYVVPAALVAKTTSGGTQTFVGCYELHLANPGIQGTPPFMPLGIRSAMMQQVDNNANTMDLMTKVCQQGGIPQAPPIPPTPTNLPNSGRYIDDRSGPLEVLGSLVNALNRKEYVRAYSYWEAGAQLPPFNQFQQGYANTQSVELITGPVSSDAGAGQFHYTVPVTLKAKTTSGTAQTYVGCYRLHLANPSIQGTPPFRPLSISNVTIQQVDNNADTAALMKKSCQ